MADLVDDFRADLVNFDDTLIRTDLVKRICALLEKVAPVLRGEVIEAELEKHENSRAISNENLRAANETRRKELRAIVDLKES